VADADVDTVVDADVAGAADVEMGVVMDSGREGGIQTHLLALTAL
jgi:hypothetical protein